MSVGEMWFTKLQECNVRLENEIEAHQATADALAEARAALSEPSSQELTAAIATRDSLRATVRDLLAANEVLRGDSAELPALRARCADLERTLDGQEHSLAYLHEVESSASAFFAAVMEEGLSSIRSRETFISLAAALLALDAKEVKNGV